MFGQGFILIYFISNFGQANNVDWNPVNATSSIFQVCFCSSPSLKFFSPFSSDYGMFGQVLILIFLIWYFCQANNVDWNPAFVRSRWPAFENRDHQNQRCWTGNNKQKLFSILYTYFLNLCSSSRLWSETIQPDKAFVFKLFKSCQLIYWRIMNFMFVCLSHSCSLCST